MSLGGREELLAVLYLSLVLRVVALSCFCSFDLLYNGIAMCTITKPFIKVNRLSLK
jgi:hypothetical protein